MRNILCLTLVLLMLSAAPVTASIGLEGDLRDQVPEPVGYVVNPRPDNVIDPGLEQVLSEAGPVDDIGILVRFRNEVRDPDHALLDRYGLEHHQTFHFIDAVHVTGQKADIKRLSQEHRVQWMEPDQVLELFMDETTTTINATKVWNTRILDPVGRISPGIDGTGVTAIVLDSGVDAGHPDLDYREKTIMNLKSDSDAGWVEVENSDSSSGHGTHCAGTIAGNGDASAGARRGVAPGANLIGLSTGEAVVILNAVGALEWTYEHSRPNNNPYNIRVVSNSWGSSGEYNPESAITVASQMITYENNVVVVFAAGNAGRENHDGHTVTTNPYSLTPSSLSIAAMERDGSGMADFSSRGIADDNFTWPDFGAPGVSIWATEARKTLISAMRKQSPDDQADAYYMSISGTSMSTPHISGVVALLFQAAPSLRVSEKHDDSMENDTAYWTDPNTRIHEVEWILKVTSRYMNASGDNGVPDNSSLGINDRANDYAQGYGIVQVDKAIALALTLEHLRIEDPETTVDDALEVYENIMVHNYTGKKTNRMVDTWFGDWSKLNDGESNMFTTTTHDVMIPNGTTEMNIVLNYNPSKSDGWEIGEITVTIDKDGDGNSDWDGGGGFNSHGYKEWTIPVDGSGQWRFNVIGQAAQIPDWWRWRNLGDNEFNEASFEYTVGIGLTMEVPEEGNITLEPWDFHARNGILDWSDPTPDFTSNCTDDTPCDTKSIVMETYWYDLSLAKIPEKPPKKKSVQFTFPCIPGLGLGILVAVVVLIYMKKKGMGPFKPKPKPKPKADTAKKVKGSGKGKD